MGNQNLQENYTASASALTSMVEQQPTTASNMDIAPPTYESQQGASSAPSQPQQNPVSTSTQQPNLTNASSQQPNPNLGYQNLANPPTQAFPTYHINPYCPSVTPLESLGEASATIDCPYCHVRDNTTVQSDPGMCTHLSALLCCLLCVCLVVVPYMQECGYDVMHRCGHCRRPIALVHGSGRVEVFKNNPVLDGKGGPAMQGVVTSAPAPVPAPVAPPPAKV